MINWYEINLFEINSSDEETVPPLALYRLYLSGSSWVLDPDPIPTVDLKYSYRTGQASFAHFSVIGSTDLTEDDRIFIQDGERTWGGIVFTRRWTKTCWQFEAIDFIDQLEEPVTVVYEAKTDVEILADLLAKLSSPLNLILDSSGVASATTIRRLEFNNQTIMSILEHLCTLTGNKFFCRQLHPLANPQLVYFTPPNSSSGISLAASDIVGRPSWERTRSTIANKISVSTTLPEVPANDGLTKNAGGAVGFGTVNVFWCEPYELCDASGYSLKVGYKIYVPENITLTMLRGIFAKTSGTPDNYSIFLSWCHPDGSTHEVQLIPASSLTTNLTLYELTGLNVELEAGLNYVQLYQNPSHATNHLKVGRIYGIRGIPSSASSMAKSCGVLSCLKAAVNENIWQNSATDLKNSLDQYSAPCFWLRGSGTPAWSEPSYPHYGRAANTADGGLLLAPYSNEAVFQISLSLPISAGDYPVIELQAHGVYLLSAGGLDLVLYLYTGGGYSNYFYLPLIPDGTRYSIPLGAGKGWFSSGLPDWADIRVIGLKPARQMTLYRLTFPAENYSKEVFDETSARLRGTKYLSVSVPFQKKSEVDNYASALLARNKDPVYAFRVQAKSIYNFTPYQKASFTLGGSPFDPLVLGMDIDPVRGHSDFIFDAYSSRDLAVLLAELDKKAGG